jgi:hypothetical protein
VTVSKYPKIQADFSKIVRKFVEELRTHFRSEIEHDPRLFKGKVLRMLKASLPPGPGRPRAELVSLAAKMRAQGKSWCAIYAECVSTTLAGDSRQVAQSRLRSAVRSRRRRLNNRPREIRRQ